MSKREALIDADILAYQAASVAEKPVDWGDGLWTLHSFEHEAQEHFDSMVNNIMEKTGAEDVTLVWSGSTNWRMDVYPEYKSNRKATRKPLVLKAIREWASNKYFSVSSSNLEGDDVIGMLATDPKLSGKYVICTIDKDMKTIPGSHYNFGSDEFFEINNHEADKWHMFQTLTGDATDGYPGCPGIGKVKAEKILNDAINEGTPWAKPHEMQEIMWKHVVAAYDKAGFGEEYALSQARVARILRHGEYDKQTQEVKLWTPNK